MYELTAAIITGAATLIAALLATQDGRLVLIQLFRLKTPTGEPVQRSSPFVRFFWVFVVGAVAGGFLFHLAADETDKAMALGGYKTPVGTIAAYMGNTAPPGWLPCNGAPVDDKYAVLKSMLVGGRTPDLQGVFLRGLDPTGKIDIDGKGTRALGSFEEDAFKQHSHPVSDVLIPASGPGTDHYDQGQKQVISGNSTAGDSPTGGTETRPKNVAVNFIIKF